MKLIIVIVLLSFRCVKDFSPNSSNKLDYPVQLTASGHDYFGFLSPNGAKIAFYSLRNTYDPTIAAVYFELWIMNSDGTDQIPIIERDDMPDGDMLSGESSWSQDSQNILVDKSDRGKKEIWKVTIDGIIKCLSQPTISAERPGYSPDGSKIAYFVQEEGEGASLTQLRVADSNFSESILIEQGHISDYAWHPNSEGLIYALYDNSTAKYNLWDASLDTGAKIQLTDTRVSEKDPSFSDDGQYIVFTINDNLFITPADTIKAKLIMENARHPKWVPNHNCILVTTIVSDDSLSSHSESLIVDLDGKIIKTIPAIGSRVVDFSQGGNYYIYSSNGNIWMDKF